MNWFLTYGEYASGIYSGQIVDVCNYLSKKSNSEFKIIALVSPKGYFKHRKEFLKLSKAIYTVPMYPKMKAFQVNIFMLLFVLLAGFPKTIIARNAIPTKLSLLLKKIGFTKRVILDGRAAESEQFKEYNMTGDAEFWKWFLKKEKEAVNNSDFRISVSNKLVTYWQTNFSYIQNNHIVIPCTLNSNHELVSNTPNIKTKLGYTNSDIILVFSGSASGWHSFNLMIAFFNQQLSSNNNVKLLLLTKENNDLIALKNNYPGRVEIIWANINMVNNYLEIADYGILLREQTITNKVASPVKFAEYLNAGLNIIITENLGDYSDFVLVNKCGVIYKNTTLSLTKVLEEQKTKNKKLAQENFFKTAPVISNAYQTLIHQFYAS